MVRRIRHQELLDFIDESLLLETDDCIEWPYATSNGYGVIRIDNKNCILPRIALMKRVGMPTPDKPHALHLPSVCHNTRCFNYRHLRWGSHRENVLDRNFDGTHNKGERNGQSKLTEDIARAIKNDKRRQYIIAKEYNLSPATICMIKSGKRWSWLV